MLVKVRTEENQTVYIKQIGPVCVFYSSELYSVFMEKQ